MSLFERITNISPVVSKVLRLMTRRQKVLLSLMLALTIGFSFVETVGISAIMPFISIVSDPALLQSGVLKTINDFFSFESPEQFIITMGIGIIIFYIFRAFYLIMLTFSMNRFSFSLYKYFSKKIFKVNLSIPYKTFTLKNSAEQMHAITVETLSTSKTILNFLQLCSEFFTIIMIYAVIVFLNWKMTLVISVILLLLVITLLSVLSKISSAQGKRKYVYSRKMNRTLKETLGNLKFIKLKGNEDAILRGFGNEINISTNSEAINNVIGIIPKGILESLGFSFLIAVVVFIVWVYRDASMVIPIISMYALALFRILPSTHRLMQNVNNMAYYDKTLQSVTENINQTIEEAGSSDFQFKRSIRLENVNFNYLTGNFHISDVSLEIKKGEKVAFIGESGSGKSTLVDILIGLHKPVSGKLYVDDTEINDSNIRSWRKKIGYIPQSIYLFDGTVAENVSFGSEPDNGKIKTALEKANIWDFLLKKEGLNTLVGDGGIQLSGGQLQRIGIARALYDDPEVLVLDEATSALDTETEQKIMDEIYNVSANKTLIVIAHRLTTVERCDRKICIENGEIIL